MPIWVVDALAVNVLVVNRPSSLVCQKVSSADYVVSNNVFFNSPCIGSV